MQAWFSSVFESASAYLAEHGLILLRNIVIIAAVAIATGPVARKADHAVRSAFARRRRAQKDSAHDRRAATVGTLAGSIMRYAVWAAGITVCLTVMGLSSQAGGLIATAGISGGVVLGFGAQKLLQDFFAGVVFLLEHPFAVGDLVSIGSLTGFVESLKLRTTVLRSFTGDKHVIPNGSIASITNLSALNSLAICDVFIPAKYPFERVEPILRAAAEEAVAGEENVVEPPNVLGITAFTDRGMMTVRTVCPAKPLEHYAIERKLRAYQLAALLRHGLLGEDNGNT